MLFSDEYKTITQACQGSFRDKGSRFLAFALPATSEAEVKQQLDALRKQYYDATHHCYAYILGFDKSAYRVNDDGEPSGTAGRPIHGQILSHDLTNILIVVVRYYGGTKLGVPGLIHAYKTAASEALAGTSVVTKIVKEVYQVDYPYEVMNDVMKIIKDEAIEVINNEFGMKCVIRLAIRHSEAGRVSAKFSKINQLVINYLSIC
ncbi:MAG: YigZ family protein [Bacteroidota bacterium]